MATGGDFSGSHSLYSDQLFDRNCTVCEEDGTISEAKCLCTVCYKYYCTQCRDFHNKFHRDHRDKLLEGAAMLKSQPKRPPCATITTMCEDHSDKLVEMYCYDHDVVCCTVCLAIHHKKCTKSEYVPKIANGFSKSPDVATITLKIHNIRKDLVAIKTSRKQDRTRIKQEKEQVLRQVEDSRRRINAVFDKLEEAVITGADTRYESFTVNIQTDLRECDGVISKIEKSIKELEDADKRNEAQLFVHAKRGAQSIDEWKDFANQLQGKFGKEKLEFRVDDDIQRYLNTLDALGRFVDEFTISGPSRTIKRGNSAGQKLGKCVDTSLTIATKPRSIVRKEDNMICDMWANKPWDIWGSCCLPDGGAILSDFNNSDIKRLNSSYQITDTCSIDHPRGVCYIQCSQEAAVCTERAINIVSLRKQMKVVKTIDMGNIRCFGVAYCNGLLYVSALRGDTLYVYEYATGKLSGTVVTNRQGKKIFKSPRHIASNKDSLQVWVADIDNGLIQLDEHCNVVRVVKIGEMGKTRGVCVDNEDNVYVCGVEPRNVMQLTANGEKVRILLGADELPASPMSIAYDNKLARLLVTMCDNDTKIREIKVIHFK